MAFRVLIATAQVNLQKSVWYTMFEMFSLVGNAAFNLCNFSVIPNPPLLLLWCKGFIDIACKYRLVCGVFSPFLVS